MGYLVFLKRLYAWVLVAGFLAGMSTTDPVPAAKADHAAEPDFAGKFLAVAFKDSQGAGCLLEKVQVRQLGGQRFLVGRVADEGTGKNPAVGVTLWIAVHEVTRIWEFKDAEEARKFYRSFPETTANKPAEGDVWDIPTRDFAMPLRIRADKRAAIAKVRLFVSADHGKSWEHCADFGPDQERVTFSAPRDGTYWFAVQTVSPDGKKDPVDTKDLVPVQKVRVKSERSFPKPLTPDEGPPSRATKE